MGEGTEHPQVGICIPVYYSGPVVPRVLERLLVSIQAQDYPRHRLHTFISLQKCDLGAFAEIAKLTNQYGCNSIHPMSNVKGPAMNTNSAMEFGRGVDYIKIMNQDDFLEHSDAITEMVKALQTSGKKWLASACSHTDSLGNIRERIHTPSWPGEKGMVEGMNRIGCPSVVMFSTELSLVCDPNVLYAMDCDMWIQLFRQDGPPVIYTRPSVVVRMWENQLTQNLDIPRQLEMDKAAMRKKYGYS